VRMKWNGKYGFFQNTGRNGRGNLNSIGAAHGSKASPKKYCPRRSG
jgi:hypothetical protein